MTDTATAARDLLARWDAQQAAFIRHRAERFATIARIVSDITASIAAPRVLDLAGGPGSLGLAVLEMVPHARLVVADKDPALLALGADATAHDDRVETVHVDLSAEAWAQHAALSAPFDAVVSSTALHWLRPDALVRVYFALADLVRPGGIVLNGDHLHYDATTECALRGIAARDDEHVQQAAFATGTETWDQWWDALARTPRYEAAMRERDREWGEELHTAPPKATLGFHIEALRSAGFTETGTVWQYLDDRVVYAIR